MADSVFIADLKVHFFIDIENMIGDLIEWRAEMLNDFF